MLLFFKEKFSSKHIKLKMRKCLRKHGDYEVAIRYPGMGNFFAPRHFLHILSPCTSRVGKVCVFYIPNLVIAVMPYIDQMEISCKCYVANYRSNNINTLRPRQNGRHFPDDIFKRIFLNENVWISLKISLKFVPKGPINNIPALVQIMAWRCPGDKPLSEAIMVSLLTHKCITQPQWVKWR